MINSTREWLTARVCLRFWSSVTSLLELFTIECGRQIPFETNNNNNNGDNQT